MVEPTTIGLVAPDDAGAIAALERAGAQSFWAAGHIASRNASPEPMMWLARLAEQTSTALIGTATLPLPLYPPALVAKQIADLDRASGGRVALGVGVAGEYASDFAAVEVPIATRGGRADEAIELIRRFWTADPVTHHGEHFRIDDVRIHPAPNQPGGPPIYISGRRDVAMRRAARLGDGWMPYLYSPRRYAASVERIRALADESGRDLAGFEWLVHLMVALDDDEDAARRGAADFFGETYQQDLRSRLDSFAVAGDVATVRHRLADYVASGARHLILCPIHGDRDAVAHRLLAEVTPGL